MGKETRRHRSLQPIKATPVAEQPGVPAEANLSPQERVFAQMLADSLTELKRRDFEPRRQSNKSKSRS